MGLMLIFTGFYGFYAACLFIQSTVFPGWLNIYLSPTTLGAIAMVITFGFAGGFTGGWFASKGDPFWTLSGGLAGVISVSAGADVYHPSLAYLLSISGGCSPSGSAMHREEPSDRRRRRRGRGARLLRLLRGLPRRDLRGRLPDRHQQHPGSFGGQLMGMMAFLPLAFLPGYFLSWILKKFNLLRVPPEVELEGLDLAEFGQDFYPEFERVPEVIVMPDGDEVDAAGVLLEAYRQTNGAGDRRRSRHKEEPCSTASRTTSGATRSPTSGRSAARTRPARTS